MSVQALLLAASLLLAVSATSAIETCTDVPAPRDMPTYGMRWIATDRCLGCQNSKEGDECLGCLNGAISKCGRCVYDFTLCSKAFGEKECSLLRYGQRLRGDKCPGNPMPYAGGPDGFPCGLMPGDDLPELNGNFTIPEARNLCAGHRNSSGDASCVAFTWNATESGVQEEGKVTMVSPQACPKDPPNHGVMWVDAPNCYGCKGDDCLGCETGNTSTCARCVYDRNACDESSTGTVECAELLYGAELRHETNCHPHPTPPLAGYNVVFKSAFKPKQPCDLSALATPLAADERSDRRSYDGARRQRLSASPPTSQSMPDLDAAFPGCAANGGCKAFSYCPGQDPPNAEIKVFFGQNNDTDLRRDVGCFSYTFWKNPPAHETRVFVV